ncbi:acyl-CoA dehydrogenase family protein [Microbacterium sp. A93]|uniref:acyl-CoA dehydrogenase family protein n=1 Tax=Microbacterium sp. A93 TaxID=3450716 RepID=UPI003F43F7FE
MSWDFSTDPKFRPALDWAKEFVRERVELVDTLWPHDVYKPLVGVRREVIAPLMEEVRRQGLWACHLTPELGGQGFGQRELAELNEILGPTLWGPRIFGTQAPDTGNAEILAKYGTQEQRDRYLQPLLDGEIFSAYSMTEVEGGSDPGVFTTRATRDGDGWVLSGRKFFTTNARHAEFLIVLAVTDPNAPLAQRMSMFLVPADAPGVSVERNFSHWTEPVGEESEGLVVYNDVRLPADALLGEIGHGFIVAQTRLGGGRVHHAMRSVGMAQRCLDMMAERALSRHTKGEMLGEKQAVQRMLADSYVAVQQFRLLVMYTAWKIDTTDDPRAVRKDIAAVKIQLPRMFQAVARDAIQLHGALGVTPELPLTRLFESSVKLGIVDGPTEVHLTTLARLLLREYEPIEGDWPSEYIPAKRQRAVDVLLGGDRSRLQ